MSTATRGDSGANRGAPAGESAAHARLQALLADSDGLLIATPEYNGAVPALVKNTLDWMSGDSDLIAVSAKLLGETSLPHASGQTAMAAATRKLSPKASPNSQEPPSTPFVAGMI